jgi:hypothetical protein
MPGDVEIRHDETMKALRKIVDLLGVIMEMMRLEIVRGNRTEKDQDKEAR